MFVIQYDDFNPFLDRFRDGSASGDSARRVLAEWKLWDHMDAILSLGVTGLVDRILGRRRTAGHRTRPTLDRHQARDLLLLAACYDQSTAETIKGRWHRLRRRLSFSNWPAYWDLALGIVVTVLVATVTILVPSGRTSGTG